MKRLSKTRLITDNRLARMNLDILIDSIQKGIFDSDYSGNIFHEKTVYADTCKFKTCKGELRYNQYSKYFYCSTCDRKQKLQFIREDKTLRKLDSIDHGIDFFRKHHAEELEFLSQLLRNLYRVTVDNLEPKTAPTEEQIQKAETIFDKSESILFSLRITFSLNSGGYEQVVTVTKNGRLMTIDEIEDQVNETKLRQMRLVDRISNQLIQQNILKLTILNIPDESKKKVNLRKAEAKMRVLLA